MEALLDSVPETLPEIVLDREIVSASLVIPACAAALSSDSADRARELRVLTDPLRDVRFCRRAGSRAGRFG